MNRAAVPTQVVRPALLLGPSTLRIIRGIEVLGWDRKRQGYAAWVVALDRRPLPVMATPGRLRPFCRGDYAAKGTALDLASGAADKYIGVS